MALQGIDISNWQNGINLSRVPCDFIIAKATESTGYVSPDCSRQVEQARSLGKLFGTYHYITGTGVEGEIDHYLSSISNWIGEGLICLDWESGGNSAWGNPAYLRSCVERVIAKTGIPPIIYVSKASMAASQQIAADLNCGLWIAQYASNATTGYQDTPWNEGAYACAIRQYSSAGRLTGWASNLDLNKFYGDAGTWKAYATGGKVEQEPVTPLPEALDGYTDLDPDAWYIPALEECVTKGLLIGHNDKMEPDGATTRAQWVVALSRLADADVSEPFDDVASSPYYYKAVEWAVEHGIVDSKQSIFRPDDGCTRADALVMLWRLMGEVEPKGEPTGYPDWSDTPDYAKKAVAWAVEQGYISGSQGGKLMPTSTITRAQAAAVLSNVSE